MESIKDLPVWAIHGADDAVEVGEELGMDRSDAGVEQNLGFDQRADLPACVERAVEAVDIHLPPADHGQDVAGCRVRHDDGAFERRGISPLVILCLARRAQSLKARRLVPSFLRLVRRLTLK